MMSAHSGFLYTLTLIPLFFLSLIAVIWRQVWHGVRYRTRRGTFTIGQTYPEDDAYMTLSRIAAMDLAGLGIFQQHYTMMLDCLKTYFAAIYGIDSGLDDRQWLHALQNAGLDETVSVLLRDVYDQAEQARKDNLCLQAATARHAISTARHIVDVTKPQRES